MIRIRIMAAVMLLVFGLSAQAEAADYNLEQVNANMPDITVYYTVPEGSDDSLASATLGSDALEIEDQVPFSATGEPIEYNILLDISKSVDETNFRQALEELITFKKTLRSGDRMLLNTFPGSQRVFRWKKSWNMPGKNVVPQKLPNQFQMLWIRLLRLNLSLLWRARMS